MQTNSFNRLELENFLNSYLELPFLNIKTALKDLEVRLEKVRLNAVFGHVF